MSLSKTLYPLLTVGSTQEDPSDMTVKIVDWDTKNLNKQKSKDNQPFKLDIVNSL